jgi:hypothetical protein
MFNLGNHLRRNVEVDQFDFIDKVKLKSLVRSKIAEECEKMAQQQVENKKIELKNMEEAAKKLLPGAEVKINGNSYRLDRDGLQSLEPLTSMWVFF